MQAVFASYEFWEFLDQLVAGSEIVIDRPRGTVHPRYPSMIYPLDYGYLARTTTVDGGGLDIWLGSSPERRLNALLLTVDLYKRDAEMNLLLGCTAVEARTALDFSNSGSMRAELISREESLQTVLRPILQSRRSVRRFSAQPVAPEILESILQAATWAPSAHNRQPWRMVVIQTRDARHNFATLLGAEFRRDLLTDGITPDLVDAQVSRSYRRIIEAPVCILLCLDASVGDHYGDAIRQGHEMSMLIQGTAMAGYAMLLAAHAAGIGGVWMCAPLFAQVATHRALDLPDNWLAQSLLLFGYPATIPHQRPRRSLAEITIYR